MLLFSLCPNFLSQALIVATTLPVQAIPFPDWISPDVFSIGKFSIKWYGVSYVLGVLGAYLWARHLTKQKEIWIPNGITRGNDVIPNKRMLEDFVFFALLGIIIGGRIGSVLLYDTAQYIENPIRILQVWKGGMAFHGGFLGVCVALIYMAKTRKISLMRISDVVACGAPIGIGLVRFLGNFVNQELYGRVTDVPWAIIFATDPGSYPRHPSQLYEAGLEGIAIFVILMIAAKKFKALTKPGICAGGFIFLYGVFRMFVELFREPDAALFGPLTRGMTYSLPMVIIGAAIVIWALRRAPVAPKRVTEPE